MNTGVNPYKNIHYAQYGNTMLKRIYCPKCKRYALVIGGEIQCCDTPIDEFKTHNVKIMCEARSKRQKPSFNEQKGILERQCNKCIYCGLEFGTLIWSEKSKKVVSLRKHFDHLVPYSYSFNNKKVNFVAACHICNGLKSNKMFENIEDVSHYVRYHRTRKGYRLLEEMEDTNMTTNDQDADE